MQQTQPSSIYERINHPNLLSLLNLFTNLPINDYQQKIQTLAKIKQHILFNHKFPLLPFVDIYQFTIDCLSNKVGKEESFLLYVLALLFKFWVKKENMKDFYDGIINVVQQRGQTLMICLKYLRTVIEVMQEEIQKENSTICQPQSGNQRFFVHKILNSFLQFGNIFSSKAIAKKESDQSFNPFQRIREDDQASLNKDEEEKSEIQGVFTIQSSEEIILQIFRLIHGCLTYDFQDFLRTEEVSEELYEFNPILLPTKYSKYSMFRQFDIFISQQSLNIEMFSYVYFTVKSQKLKIKTIQLLGDLSRIHFRYFKSRIYHKNHIENIAQIIANMFTSLSLNSEKNLERAISFSFCLRKLFKQAVFFSMNQQIISSIIDTMQKFITDSLNDGSNLSLQNWIYFIRSFAACFMDLALQFQYHLPAQSEHLYEQLYESILIVGKCFEEFMYFSNKVVSKQKEIDLLQDPILLSDTLFIFRIYKPKLYDDNWKGDERYLMSLLAQFQFCFCVVGGAINRNKMKAWEIQNSINGMKRCMKCVDALLQKRENEVNRERPENQEEENSSTTAGCKSDLNKNKFAPEKIASFLTHISELIASDLRIPLKYYLEQTSTHPLTWLHWSILNYKFDLMKSLLSIVPQCFVGEEIPLVESILKLLPKTYKVHEIQTLINVLLKIMEPEQYEEERVKEVIMGQQYQCNKGSNKWLILSIIIKHLNENKGYNARKQQQIYKIIVNQYLHLYDIEEPTISNSLLPLRQTVLETLNSLLARQEKSDNNVKYTLFTKIQPLFMNQNNAQILINNYYSQALSILYGILLAIYPNKHLYEKLMWEKYKNTLIFTDFVLSKATEVPSANMIKQIIEFLLMCSECYPEIFDYQGEKLYQISEMLQKISEMKLFIGQHNKIKLYLKIISFLFSQCDKVNWEVRKRIVVRIIEHIRSSFLDKDFETTIQMIRYYAEVMSLLYNKYNEFLNETITEVYIFSYFVRLEEKGMNWLITKIKEQSEYQFSFDCRRSTDFFGSEGEIQKFDFVYSD